MEEEVWETEVRGGRNKVISRWYGAGVIDGDAAVVIYHTASNTPPLLTASTWLQAPQRLSSAPERLSPAEKPQILLDNTGPAAAPIHKLSWCITSAGKDIVVLFF